MWRIGTSSNMIYKSAKKKKIEYDLFFGQLHTLWGMGKGGGWGLNPLPTPYHP